MDFVTCLPQTCQKHDAVWVVVDGLTKTTWFLPIRTDYSISKLSRLNDQHIIRLHGVPVSIVSEISGSPQIFGGVWIEHLPLVEFSYNNSFPASIGMSLCEALYGRPCRSPLCWAEAEERLALGPELIQETTDKVRITRDRLWVAQSR